MSIILYTSFIGIVVYLILKGPKSQVHFNRVGKHIYFEYKGNTGHVTLNSDLNDNQVDYDKIGKFVKGMSDGKIKTKPIYEKDKKSS